VVIFLSDFAILIASLTYFFIIGGQPQEILCRVAQGTVTSAERRALPFASIEKPAEDL